MAPSSSFWPGEVKVNGHNSTVIVLILWNVAGDSNQVSVTAAVWLWKPKKLGFKYDNSKVS